MRSLERVSGLRVEGAMERVLYLRVIAMSAKAAKRFAGVDQEPIDLGPVNDPSGRWKEGARVWGFPREPRNAKERAAIAWKIDPDGE